MSARTTLDLYPLRFREILRPYGFGERWIPEAFTKPDLPAEGRIAETWEVCDRPGESSVVVNGPLAGRTLGELIALDAERLLGTEIVARFGGTFPLIVKLLDATNALGEQCHPDDELVRRWGEDDFSGKTEAWCILRTRPGARVLAGSKEGVTRRQLRRALEAGAARSLMVDRPAAPEDTYLLYAGTMHYTPGGILLYEIMQNSDVTLGMGPRVTSLPPEQRERAIDRALEAVHLEDRFDPRTQPVTVPCEGGSRTFLLACEEFVVERSELESPFTFRPDGEPGGDEERAGRRFCVLTVIAGAAEVLSAGPPERLLAGQTCLLPAALGRVTLAPAGYASLMCAYVPDLMRDVVEPLREAGAGVDAIRGLGGRTELNPLNFLC